MQQETIARWGVISRIGAVALVAVPPWASYFAPPMYIVSFSYGSPWCEPSFVDTAIRYGGATVGLLLPIALGVLIVLGAGRRATIGTVLLAVGFVGIDILVPERDECVWRPLDSKLALLALLAYLLAIAALVVAARIPLTVPRPSLGEGVRWLLALGVAVLWTILSMQPAEQIQAEDAFLSAGIFYEGPTPNWFWLTEFLNDVQAMGLLLGPLAIAGCLTFLVARRAATWTALGLMVLVVAWTAALIADCGVPEEGTWLMYVPWPLVATAALIGTPRIKPVRPRWFPANTTRDLLVLIVAVALLGWLVLQYFTP
ncbi:hypothetical protein Aph01nite_20680 [Acrocarpospora phusangensis]|uniref:Uncharacterized protein n=1 Tax=Acrocarpospora phusangensis TaxID=1070424 RepID=A0A919QAD2_9ACTN|nr:hypothetical protein [Acrocarpospora phusangensis]GIH23758.1 hypothetical protein Aph01nite_20680 [Acrocarpospora phusangensis]